MQEISGNLANSLMEEGDIHPILKMKNEGVVITFHRPIHGVLERRLGAAKIGTRRGCSSRTESCDVLSSSSLRIPYC